MIEHQRLDRRPYATLVGALVTSSLIALSLQAASVHAAPTATITLANPGEACTAATPPPLSQLGIYRKDSTPTPPLASKLPKDAPNVLVWVMDDVGFGQLSPFGGLVPMPTLERIAARGLRYSNFHVTPLCSPTRAALLTGRNSHSVHMGSHGATAMPFPGYDAIVPKSAATTAQVLRDVGYSTMAIGKWDHLPSTFISPAGPFNLWPTGQGFEHYYGFMSYETDNFAPTLWREHTPLFDKEFPEGYHLSTDMADEATRYFNTLRAADPEKPFYLYWATGASHAPHHAPKEWRERFKGKFDLGWDAYRQKVFANQKRKGLIPSRASLPLRPAELPAWNSLSSREKALYARQMEAFAAQIAHADHEFGRVLDALESRGELENTLVVVLSDNGATAEGGLTGQFATVNTINGRTSSFEENFEHREDWGGRSTSPQYHSAWAMAGNTPFRYYKHTAHRGGHQVPMVLSWPRKIKKPGVRTQYHHAIDVSPTIFAAVGIGAPDCVLGVVQQPIDGVSMNYSFDSVNTPSRRTRQYYEMFGNRSIEAGRWSAAVSHKVATWKLREKGDFFKDQWELYDLANDPTQTRDLSRAMPEKTRELAAIFDDEARKFNVYPLDDDLATRLIPPSTRNRFVFSMPGVHALNERFAPALFRKDYRITVKVEAPALSSGVLIANGGAESGYTLYAIDGQLRYEYLDLDGARYRISSDQPLPQGQSVIEFRFTITSGVAGVGELFINGRKVGESTMRQSAIVSYSGSDLFNIGADAGGPVSNQYRAPYPFTGRVQEVAFDLGPVRR